MRTKRKRLPLAMADAPKVTTCNNCGACCTAQEALPVGWYLGANQKAAAILPVELFAELVMMRDRFNLDGWPGNGEACVWYDAETRKCKHYDYRPDVCRDAVKVNDEACHRWRRALGIEKQNRYTFKNGKLVKT